MPQIEEVPSSSSVRIRFPPRPRESGQVGRSPLPEKEPVTRGRARFRGARRLHSLGGEGILKDRASKVVNLELGARPRWGQVGGDLQRPCPQLGGNAAGGVPLVPNLRTPPSLASPTHGASATSSCLLLGK